MEWSNLLIGNSLQKWNSAIIATVLTGTAGSVFAWGLFGFLFDRMISDLHEFLYSGYLHPFPFICCLLLGASDK